MSKRDPIRCVHSTDKSYHLEFQDGTEALIDQNEWPHKMEANPILWALEGDTPDIEGRYYERRIMNLGIMAWEWKSNVNIREARRNEVPLIRNRWSDGAHDDLFGSRPTTLYYAYLPGQGSVSGIMVGNDDYLWGGHPGVQPLPTGGGEKVYDLQHTITHELGHILGLRHEANYRDHVMWPSYNQQRVPQDNDVLRIQAKYDVKNRNFLSSAWIKRRLNRGLRQKDI